MMIFFLALGNLMIDRLGLLWRMPWPTMTTSGFYHLVQWIFAGLLAAGAYALAAQRIGATRSPASTE